MSNPKSSTDVNLKSSVNERISFPVNERAILPSENSNLSALQGIAVHGNAPRRTGNAQIIKRKLAGFVGFANLPNQWHRKSVRKGFNFNIMVVGTSYSNMNSNFKAHFCEVNLGLGNQL